MSQIDGEVTSQENYNDALAPVTLEKEFGAGLSCLLKHLFLEYLNPFRLSYQLICSSPALTFVFLIFAYQRHIHIVSEIGLTVEWLNEDARKASDFIAANASQPTKNEHETFQSTVNIFLPLEQEIKPLERQLNENLLKVPTYPMYSFLISMLHLIIERRFWRNYLRSRFGMKRLLQSKKSKDFLKHYDFVLFSVGTESLACIESQFYAYLYAMYLIASKWQDPFTFSLKNYLSDVVTLIGKHLQDYRLNLLNQRLDYRREHSESYDIELANFTANAEVNLNFSPNSKNQRLLKALEVYGEGEIREKIAGSVLIALNEKDFLEPFSSGTGETSVLSRIARQLEVKNSDLRLKQLEPEHENKIVSNIEEFTARENARIDYNKRILTAHLTLNEMEIVQLKIHEPDITNKEIAERRGITEGAVKKVFFDIRKKLRTT